MNSKSIRTLAIALFLTLTLAGCFQPLTPTPAPATANPTDSCLLGMWTMGVYELNNKLLDLTGAGNIYVLAPSAMTLEFRPDNTFALYGQITMHAEMDSGNYMEMDSTHEHTGRYAISGSTLKTSDVTNNVEYGEMRVYINGELSTAPMPAPTVEFSPPVEAQYVCSSDLLKITITGPFGPVMEEWRR